MTVTVQNACCPMRSTATQVSHTRLKMRRPHLLYCLPSDPYISDSGKRVVNVVLKVEDQCLVTKVLVKVQNNELGAKAGLVFLFNHDNPAEDSFLEQFAQYDSWTSDDFHQHQEDRYLALPWLPTTSSCPSAHIAGKRINLPQLGTLSLTKTGVCPLMLLHTMLYT